MKVLLNANSGYFDLLTFIWIMAETKNQIYLNSLRLWCKILK